MARILRTDIYDFDTLPTFDDYVIGTDSEDSLRTKNYRIGDLATLFGVSSKYYKGFITGGQAAGGTDTIVIDQTIPANTLANDGDSIDYMFMVLGASTNLRAQVLSFNIGGTSKSFGYTANAVEIIMRGSLIRISSTLVFWTIEINDSAISEGVAGQSSFGDVSTFTVTDLAIDTFQLQVRLTDASNSNQVVAGFIRQN